MNSWIIWPPNFKDERIQGEFSQASFLTWLNSHSLVYPQVTLWYLIIPMHDSVSLPVIIWNRILNFAISDLYSYIWNVSPHLLYDTITFGSSGILKSSSPLQSYCVRIWVHACVGVWIHRANWHAILTSIHYWDLLVWLMFPGGKISFYNRKSQVKNILCLQLWICS